MMTGGGNNGGQLTVPPGFRFHPTDEELLYYYLRKKVSYESIDLDVIREVDLNKLEPWDLKEKCRIGTGQQNEWYFFSHKDKKYPTGTRTNRATTAGFWKATGRDKSIHMTNNNKRIGMRKTLVFYTGRAPHGQKTDWIMHEYRLNEEDADDQVLVQEDGWVVCRVFKKKTHNIVRSGYHQSEFTHQEEEEEMVHMKSSSSSAHHHHQHHVLDQQKQNHHHQAPPYDFTALDSSMHLPLLFSPESAVVSPLPFISPLSLNTMDTTTTLCPQNNLLSLTSNGGGGGGGGGGGAGGLGLIQQERLNNNSDWSFLDKLLASHQSLQDYHQLSQQSKCHHHHPASSQQQVVVEVGTSAHHKFPFHYLGCETDILKYSK